jgi:hypothetical protein
MLAMIFRLLTASMPLHPLALRPFSPSSQLRCSWPPLMLESSNLELEDANVDEAPPSPPSFSCEDMPGISAPLGFFDPAGFSDGATEGRVKFFREVELKHGRVAMLAALGFPLAENFHPLFGGEIDVPSYGAHGRCSFGYLPMSLIACIPCLRHPQLPFRKRLCKPSGHWSQL